MWNHGGSADDVEGLSGVVSVASPASSYLSAMLDALALGHRPSARPSRGRPRRVRTPRDPGRTAGRAPRLGLSIVGSVTHDEVPESPDADVLLLAGSFEQDLELLRRLRKRPTIIGTVAAGLGRSRTSWVAGSNASSRPPNGRRACTSSSTSAPSRHKCAALRARVLPTLSVGAGTGHIEYPSAQAYAAVLVALRCVEDAGSLEDEALRPQPDASGARRFLDDSALLQTAGNSSTRCSSPSGAPAGVKRIVWPPELAEADLDVNAVTSRPTRSTS